MKKTAVVAASAVALLGIGISNAPLAFAHDASAGFSLAACDNTRCGYGGVTNNHTRVYACDTASDGYGFQTYYYLRNYQNGYVDDANGSDSGCSSITPGTAANPVAWFEVCWKKTPKYICSPQYAA